MNKIIKYNNGLRLVLNKIAHTRSVAVGLVVGIGSGNEAVENNGLSHFTEHMLFNGTKSRTAFELVNRVESLGANINAFTSKEETTYYTISSKEYLSECLDVLSDMFFNSIFSQESIEKEKTIIVEEINMNLDNPDSLCMDNLSSAHFGQKSYGLTILGKEEKIMSYQRDDFFNFIDTYYRADNVIVSISGDIDFNECENLVFDYFASKFSSKKVEKSIVDTVPIYDNISVHKDIKQSNVAFAFQSMSRADRSFVPQVFSSLTAGTMSSRLFQKIREELGIVYDISLYSKAYWQCGLSILSFGTSDDNVERAIAETWKELDKIKQNGFSESELKMGIEQLKLKIMLGNERSISCMLNNAYSLLYFNKAYSIDDEIDELKGVTIDKLVNYAKTYFTCDNISSSYVGPSKSADLIELSKKNIK